MISQSPIRRHRSGASLVYMTVAMVVFVAFVSLAVDVGHVRNVKGALQVAADGAARYAAAGFTSGGITPAQSNAVYSAAQNTADESPVVVDPNNDVEFGTWDAGSKTFTVLSGASRNGANAIRVTCRRTTARGNPVSLWFAAVIGKPTADVTAQSIATMGSGPVAAFTGFSSVTFKNNTFFGSYNSSNTTTPTQASADNHSTIGSNGAITGGNNNSEKGNAILGPSGSVSGVTISGSQQPQSSSLGVPSMPAWQPQTNPAGVPQAYTVSSDTTLPGGSYWFTSLTVTGSLTFSGPAIVYINGNADVSSTLAPSSGVPADLTIYQYGSQTFGNSGANGLSITANIIAPGSNFEAKNNLNFFGSGIFNSIDVQNNANFFYDESLGVGGAATAVKLVQ